MTAELKKLIRSDCVDFKSGIGARWAIDWSALSIAESDIKCFHRLFLGLRCTAEVVRSEGGCSGFIMQVPENAYLSNIFSLKGLGNPASVCHRQVIELFLKYIYFDTHPVEFSWVCSDVSIRDFGYSFLYDYIQRLGLLSCVDDAGSVLAEISRIFNETSRYVHVHNTAFLSGGMEVLAVSEIHACFKQNLKLAMELFPLVSFVLIINHCDRYLSASSAEKGLIGYGLGKKYKAMLVKYIRNKATDEA